MELVEDREYKVMDNPFSEMEKQYLAGSKVTLVSIEKTHGYARVKDDAGVIWHVHPECLEEVSGHG